MGVPAAKIDGRLTERLAILSAYGEGLLEVSVRFYREIHLSVVHEASRSRPSTRNSRERPTN